VINIKGSSWDSKKLSCNLEDAIAALPSHDFAHRSITSGFIDPLHPPLHPHPHARPATPTQWTVGQATGPGVNISPWRGCRRCGPRGCVLRTSIEVQEPPFRS